MRAKGKFNVKLLPLDTFTIGSDGMTLGRMSIEKTFCGVLVATG